MNALIAEQALSDDLDFHVCAGWQSHRLGRWRRVLLLATVSAFSLGMSNARAQNFTVDWFTVDGGGGTSSGGVFAVSGTIGQADTRRMSGGNYTIDGGYWGFIAASPVPVPKLTIELAGHTVRICWPSSFTGFVVQSTDSLSAPSWTDVAQSPSDSGVNKCVTVPAEAGTKFFRLKKQ